MGIESQPDDKGGLPAENAELIERFEAAYNSIDHQLRGRLGAKPGVPFTQVVDRYAAGHPSWSDSSDLKLFAKLRNFVIHNMTRPYQRLAIPTLDVVVAIEAVRDRLAARVLPAFQRNVVTVRLGDSLAQVLGLVDKYSFSQFPVYDPQNEYCGLLTENGITRWLARHTVREMTLVEFEDVTVEELLSAEEQRPNCTFVAGTTAVDDVAGGFGQNPHLEAVLITENGDQREALLGIATRWDFPELLQRARSEG